MARIVRAADYILTSTGDVRMQSVAAHAGVSLATLYALFPSKDLLVLTLGVHRMQRGLERVSSGTPLPGVSPGERLASFLLRYFRSAQKEPTVARALALLDPLRESEDNTAELERLRSEMASLIRRMAVTASFGADNDPDHGAEGMMTHALSLLHIGCMGWLSGVLSAADVRRSLAFGALLIDLPGEQTSSLFVHADAIAARLD